MTPITFDLQIEGLNPGTIQVVRIAGEESLTRPYRFDIDVISSRSDLPLDAFLATSATLSLSRGDDKRVIHGVILQASDANEAKGGSFSYRLTLVPRVSLLALSRHNRTFGTASPLSVLEVINSVLSDPTGLAFGPDDLSIRMSRQEAYPTRDFWAQYDESDFDFVHRLLEHWGIVYYFEQAEKRERIVFTDATNLAPAQTIDGTLTFRQDTAGDSYGGGLVRSMTRRLKAVPKTVHLSDYNDQTPQLRMTATSDVPQGLSGAYYEYGTHFLTEEEGKLFAQARAEEIGCTRQIFLLKSDSPFSTPGVTFALAQHFREGFNQSYLPTAIRHTGHQYVAGAFWDEAPETPSAYNAEITAIPSATAYRSPRTVSRPVMAGVMPAKVDAPRDDPGDRAVLDDQGRYKVALDFDTAANDPYKKSNFLRMAQPYGGPKVGLHFPLLKETEVIIGWIDGDPDRPLILGAVPNPLTKSPVTNTNATHNRIDTAGGIAMIMNDGPGTPPAAADGEQQPPPAPSPTTATGGVYAATVVPPSEGSLPHYERLGAVATDTPYEANIIADPSFRAETVDYRGKDHTNDAYEGIFSYTPKHRTTTTGGHETTVVNGDQRNWVGGTSTSVVVGDANAEPSAWEKYYTTASVDCPYYNASVYKSPKISYYDGEYMSVYNGLTLRYGFGVDFRVLANVLGTFQHRVGASLTLSGTPAIFTGTTFPKTLYGLKPYGSSYSLSTSGYTYKQIAGIDKSHCIFGTEKIVLGFRGEETGGPTMNALTTIANSASNFCLGGLGIAEAAQTLVILDGEVGNAGELGMLAMELAAVSPITWAYVKAIRAVVDYFNGSSSLTGGAPLATSLLGRMTQKDLTTNKAVEPTVTVDVYGVTLVANDAKIALATETPLIPENKALGIKAQKKQTKGLKISFGENSFIEFTDKGIKIRAPSIDIGATNHLAAGIAADTGALTTTLLIVDGSDKTISLGGDKIELDAVTKVKRDLQAEKNCTVTGQVSAASARIG